MRYSGEASPLSHNDSVKPKLELHRENKEWIIGDGSCTFTYSSGAQNDTGVQ